MQAAHRVQVDKPEAASQRPAVRPGPDQIQRLLAAWARDANPVDLLRLRDYLAQRPEIPLGTMCSGTDMPAAATQAFCSWARREFGNANICSEYRFGAEKSAAKRAFIQAVHGRDARLFGDVAEVQNGEAFCHNRGVKTEVPPVSLLAAGFPCQDASRLNIYRATEQNQTCVEKGTLRTGGVLADILSFVSSRPVEGMPELLILENVASLADKGKNASMSGLEALG